MLKEYDKPFFAISSALVLFGLFALASASLGLAREGGTSMYQSLSRQILLGIGVGGILFFIGLKMPYKLWRKLALPIFLFSIGLMLLVYEKHIGFSYAGAQRWLNLGYFFFQPAELLKFGFLVYIASWIASRREDVSSFKFGFLPFLIIIGFVGVLLIIQPDIGTLGVITITASLLFYIGGGKVSQLGFMIVLGFILLSLLVVVAPYRIDRVQVFLNPTADLTGSGYQLHQSLIAVGSGGIFGNGFGMSIQKFEYLPEAMGDSIFAVIAEEFGFVGSLLLILAFLFFLQRGLKIARGSPDIFGRLLGSGFVILIVIQSFINIGALIGLLPLTGLPLIFISQGGSSLAIALLEVGVILNISKYAKY